MRFLVIALLFLSLSACVGHDLKKLEYAGMAGNSYYDQLARSYRDYAVEQKDKRDWNEAQIFARKAEQADHGLRINPEHPQEWQVRPEMLQTLIDARNELLDAVTTEMIEAQPAAAAQATFSYDCWVEQEENWEKEEPITCRDDFFEALDIMSVSKDPNAPLSMRQSSNAPVVNAEQAKHMMEAPEVIDASVPQSRPAFPLPAGADLRQPLSMQLQPLSDETPQPTDTPCPCPESKKATTPPQSMHYSPSRDTRPAVRNNTKKPAVKKAAPKKVAPKIAPKKAPVKQVAPKHTPKIAPPAPKAAAPAPKPKPSPTPEDENETPRAEKPAMEEVPVPEAATTEKPVSDEALKKTKLQGNVIYFAPDMVAINEEGVDVLNKIVEATKGEKPVTILIHGHTDRAEAKDEKMKFSIRRANAVRDALVEMGIDPNIIKVFGFADGDLARPTEPDVADALNRRVEIIVE